MVSPNNSINNYATWRCTSLRMEGPVVRCSVDSSYVVCKFIHSSAEVPK